MSTMRNLPHVIAVGGSVAATPSSVFGSFWRLRPAAAAARHNGADQCPVHYKFRFGWKSYQNTKMLRSSLFTFLYL